MSDPKSPTSAPATPAAPAAPAQSTPPIPLNRMRQIANDACTFALEKAETYDHTRTEAWNSAIINQILRALISESAPAVAASSSSSSPAPSPWKFAVNSTIIQHLSAKGDGSEGTGRRGMHSAQGAYWNNEKDGMWSYKHETRCMDVVVSIIWIAV